MVWYTCKKNSKEMHWYLVWNMQKTIVHNSMFQDFSHRRKLQSNTSSKEIFNIEKWACIKFNWCNKITQITNLLPLWLFIMIMIKRHDIISLSVIYKLCVPTSCSINNDIPSKTELGSVLEYINMWLLLAHTSPTAIYESIWIVVYFCRIGTGHHKG